MTITSEQLNQAFEILTDNNFHNDTSILDCYLAFGIVPIESEEHDKLWSILDELKEIDRKNDIQGFLRCEDVEHRNKLDKQVKAIINKFVK